MIVTLQIQLDPEAIEQMHRDSGDLDRAARTKIDFTIDELKMIHDKMLLLCSELESLSYIRAGMYVDDQVWVE